MEKIAIVWGSTSARTEDAADKLAELVSDLEPELLEVTSVSAEEMTGYEVLIVGVPTWDIGELQYDWGMRYPQLEGVDFSGTRVAFFGAGDSQGYPENFLDALGIMWERFAQCGAHLIGKWPTDEYDFDSSRALIDGGANFVGLGIDESLVDTEVTELLGRWSAKLREEIAATSGSGSAKAPAGADHR